MAYRRVAARLAAVLILLTGLPIALGAAIFLPYLLAKLFSSAALLVTISVFLFAVCVTLTGWSAKCLWQVESRKIVPAGVALLTVAFTVSLYLVVLRPMRYPHLVAAPRANTKYWELPTGSRIAYSLYEPSVGAPVRPDPIIFLHGGPGYLADDLDHAFYRQFVADGFRVYLYDQAGSGLSSRRPVRDYTLERDIADLEAIRQQIGADRLILIGHSWGGSLAAQYAVAHANHISKLVFHSPAGIRWTGEPNEYERTAAAGALDGKLPIRAIAAFSLFNKNPEAAERLVSQDQFGDWEVASLNPGQVVCKGEMDRIPANTSRSLIAGINIYPLLQLHVEMTEPHTDVYDGLRKLSVPAIALYSQCDFIPWDRHSEYRQTIPGLKEFYFPDAGHYIDISQPQKLFAVIRAFLLDQPPPFPPYEGDTDPRPPTSVDAR
jgi:proline-specific peptidase